ncbi:MAG: NlpC/P60 family protein [Bacteroidia bacterium]|nr:NlpC/P60 family protein [Bacteroidia bacterium]
MNTRLPQLKFSILAMLLAIALAFQACAPQTEKAKTEHNADEKHEAKVVEPQATEKNESVSKEPEPEKLTTDGEEMAEGAITQELLDLEAEYKERLAPVASLKSTQPQTYWFIVSWLKTAYKTPDWTGYTAENYEAWRVSTKARGIDCSGFSRVMLDQVFDKKIAGGSQGLLDNYSTRVERAAASMGDLVFFKAPGSETGRIIHVGVYLQDDYFVHATSTKSAAKGFGLNINSLEENRWSSTLVAIGRVKS